LKHWRAKKNIKDIKDMDYEINYTLNATTYEKKKRLFFFFLKGSAKGEGGGNIVKKESL
jgi:hypothetical protein